MLTRGRERFLHYEVLSMYLTLLGMQKQPDEFDSILLRRLPRW